MVLQNRLFSYKPSFSTSIRTRPYQTNREKWWCMRRSAWNEEEAETGRWRDWFPVWFHAVDRLRKEVPGWSLLWCYVVELTMGCHSGTLLVSCKPRLRFNLGRNINLKQLNLYCTIEMFIVYIGRKHTELPLSIISTFFVYMLGNIH